MLAWAVAWTGIILLFAFIFLQSANVSNFSKPVRDYLNSFYPVLESVLFGILFGILFSLINSFTDSPFFIVRSYGRIILVKSALYFLAVMISSFLIYFIYAVFDLIPDEFLTTRVFNIFSSWLILCFTVYIVLFIFIFNMLIIINKKFGPGILYKLFTGKYYRPKDENRIFLFLDMRNSTVNDEKM